MTKLPESTLPHTGYDEDAFRRARPGGHASSRAERSRARHWDGVLYVGVAVGVGLMLLAGSVEFYWLRDLKFDDAWIHFRYAQNLAHGKGFVYNEGERVLGSGGIAWEVILAVLARMTTSDTLPYAVSTLNYIALVACGALLYMILREMLLPWLALGISALLIAQGPLPISSIGGMETTLLCVGYFSTLLALLRERYVLAAFFAGVTVCLRVESLALLAATLLAALLYRRRASLAVLAAGVTLPLLAHGWAWAYFGSLVPNSTLAKSVVYVEPPHGALIACFRSLLDVFPFDHLVPNRSSHPDLARWLGILVWLVLVEVGYLVLRRRRRAASLVIIQVVGAFAFYTVANPYMFDWYECTFVPLAMLFAVLGVCAITGRIPGLRAAPSASALVIVVIASFGSLRSTWSPFGPDDPRFSFTRPNAQEHTRTYQYVNIARWLNERSTPTDRVCISEIGAFGYHYRGRILDGIGLVSPEVLPYHPLPEGMRPSGRTGAIPPRVVRDFLPEFVVSLDVFAEALFEEPWFNRRYRMIGRWPWFGAPAPWRDVPALVPVLGGKEIRAYRRVDAVRGRVRAEGSTP